MRYAVIDAGTNSIKLLVADALHHHLTSLLEASESTRLGEDVSKNHRLLPEAMDRTLEAAARLVARGRELHSEKFLAYTTSAVRDSSNRADFLRRFCETTGVACNVVSGEEEAELTFLGATSHPVWREREAIVFDIGGGSIEFMRGKGGALDFKASFDCGAVRMTETFIRSDPPTSTELGTIHRSVCDSIGGLKKRMRRRDAGIEPARSDTPLLLGTGGTLCALAFMELGLERPDPARIEGYRFGLDRLRTLRDSLSGMSLERRTQIPGLHGRRADIIVAGTVVLVAGLEMLGRDEITVSTRSLRYGAILRDGAPQ